MEIKNFELKGAKELQDAIKELPATLQAKVLKAFFTSAGRKFIVNPLKTQLNYSKETENALKTFNNPDNPVSVLVGVASPQGYKLNWTELGTKVRTGKKGQNKGKITAQHRVEKQIEGSAEQIVDYVNTEMGNYTDKYIKRQLKKITKSK